MKALFLLLSLLCLSQLLARPYVTYEDFGAKGDGKNNDFPAIVRAHVYANEHKRAVKARSSATYYIGGDASTAIIETDTDFQEARFIIDDREAVNGARPVFKIQSALSPITLPPLKSIKKAQARLPLRPAADILLIVKNNQVKHYIRRGRNANAGSAQADSFLVDKRGFVHKDTPILWDFEHISHATAKPLDKNTLRITGGHFTTIVNRGEEAHRYYKRGFEITRSRVLIDGMQPAVMGEDIPHSHPYLGFININQCAYINIKNCRFTGRKTFTKEKKLGKKTITAASGSYDIALHHAHFVSLENCTQFNSIHDKRYWGIMASNYAKNVSYKHCKLSRFDAHRGIYNAQIIDSEIGHVGINLIGGGHFLLQASHVHANRLINLRSDYSSTWDGSISIINSQWTVKGANTKNACIFTGHNDGVHDFGYPCRMPRAITIDALHIHDSTLKAGAKLYLFANFNRRVTDPTQKRTSVTNYPIPESIKLQRIKIDSGRTLKQSPNTAFFPPPARRR